MRVYLTTATGALSSASQPVGGGVAVLEALLPYLAAQPGWDVTVVRPQGPGLSLPDGVSDVALPVPVLAATAAAALLALSEREYARFALQWERALGTHFADLDPSGSVVFANDISEGPPFAELARRGFAQVAIYHVVVADFFARRYLRERWRMPLSGPVASRLWRLAERLRLSRLAPDVARLVWAKEGEAARHATAIVPSRPLAQALAACYPASGVGRRTRTVPWGVVGPADPARRADRAETLAAFKVDPRRFLLTTLSRLSPEKRIELLIDALARIERDDPVLADDLALVVAGAPAYMGGERYASDLRRAAARLSRAQVRFPGYVSGEAKWDLLAATDLFCSPSSYEAYGLTIAQALASGGPVLAADHQGARATVDPGRTGSIESADPAGFARAIVRARGEAPAMRAHAAAWGRHHPFSEAAEEVVAVVRAAGEGSSPA